MLGSQGLRVDFLAASQTAKVLRIAIWCSWWENLGETQKTVHGKGNQYQEPAIQRYQYRLISLLLASIFPAGLGVGVGRRKGQGWEIERWITPPLPTEGVSARSSTLPEGEDLDLGAGGGC